MEGGSSDFKGTELSSDFRGGLISSDAKRGVLSFAFMGGVFSVDSGMTVDTVRVSQAQSVDTSGNN